MAEGNADRDGTVCPRCAVGCRLRAQRDHSRAKGVAGPANPDGRLCQKGVQAFESLPDADRITRPLVRSEGALEPTTWADALDRVVEGIEATVEEYGPDALSFMGAPRSTNEANYLLQKVARTLGTNNVDNRARLCHVSTATALSRRIGWPASTNGLADLRDADLILTVGANPAQRQPVAFNSYVRPALTDGAALVHIDPVGNQTTRVADVHISPRPGTDAVVLTLLCRAVLDAGGHDESFIDRRTASFEQFTDALAVIDRERLTGRAGVDWATLCRTAARLADADRIAAIVGTGIEDDDCAASDALVNLLLLTGSFGRRGTGIYVFRGLANEQGATDAGCVPDRLPGHQPVTDPDARSRVADVWGVEPPPTAGLTAHQLLAQSGEDIRAAVVVGENPAVSKRDPEWVETRLDGLDTLAVVELTHSATTRHADVVLPAGAGVETRGTVTNLDRQVQPLRPVYTPPDGVRSDWEILRTLGRRLCGGQFDYPDMEAVFEEFTRVAPTHHGMAVPGTDGTRWPSDSGRVLYREAFETASGRAPFVVPPLTVGTPDSDGLTLVVGGRATAVERATDAEQTVRLHPEDATTRDITDGTRVRVGADGVTVEGVATVSDTVRTGTVFLHAQLADALLRTDTRAVAVERAE